MSDTKQKLTLAERGRKYLPTNSVVSPEIDIENARRGGYGVDAADIFHKLSNRNRTEKLDLPDGVDVEKTLIDGGAYKLGTGGHHVTQTNNGLLSKKLKNPLPPALLEGVLFKIQNVRDYYMAHGDEHNWHDPESIFAAKLPFDRVVFAYDHDFRPVPVTEFGNDIVADFRKSIRRHVNVVMEKVTVADVLRHIAASLLPEKDGNELAHILDRRQPDSLIKATFAMDGNPYPGTWFVMIDETGHCLTDPMHKQNWLWIRSPAETAQVAYVETQVGQDQSDVFARHGMICLTAVQFLNCRNVEVIDNPPSRQQRRHAERMGERPPVTYKTLVIHAMGQKRVKTHNDDGTVRHGVPLHIVRGHFKNYMSGAGLGRSHMHGVYWWSPSVRGNPEKGRIEKDYAIEAE